MVRNKLLLNCLVILLVLYISTKYTQAQEEEECGDLITAPINLNPSPEHDIPYKDFKIILVPKKINPKSKKVKMNKIDTNTISMEAKWGNLIAHKKRYEIKTILFKSPSEHYISDSETSIEVQAVATLIVKKGKKPPRRVPQKIVLVYLSEPYSERNSNDAFKSLGFWSGERLAIHEMKKVKFLADFKEHVDYVQYQGQDLTLIDKKTCDIIEYYLSITPFPIGMRQMEPFGNEFGQVLDVDRQQYEIGKRKIFQNCCPGGIFHEEPEPEEEKKEEIKVEEKRVEEKKVEEKKVEEKKVEEKKVEEKKVEEKEGKKEGKKEQKKEEKKETSKEVKKGKTAKKKEEKEEQKIEKKKEGKETKKEGKKESKEESKKQSKLDSELSADDLEIKKLQEEQKKIEEQSKK